MKAILMCAGKSTRTLPITEKVPKPLLKIVDKSIIMHTLDQLIGTISTAIVVVGYLKDQIIMHLGSSYRGIEIVYEIQENISGTGAAVYNCKKYFEEGEKFLVLNGDDLYAGEDISKLLNYDIAILAMKVSNPSQYGVLQIDENSYLLQIIEKPQIYIGDLVNSGCYFLNYKIFYYLSKTEMSERGEIELTTAIHEFSNSESLRFKIVPVEKYWKPINYPSTYLDANIWYLRNKFEFSGSMQNKFNEFVFVKNNVYISSSAVIYPFNYIEGPVFIGDNCRIGPFNSIYPNTIIMSDCVISRSDLEDSLVLGNSVLSGENYKKVIADGESIKIDLLSV